MNRYKKANEGIHAPEHVKEKAACPVSRRSRAHWIGTVAAVLAVVLIGSAVLRPEPAGEPVPMSLSGPGADGPGTRTASALNGCALAVAQYPETVPLPRYEDYFANIPDEEEATNRAWDAYETAYDAWLDSRQALRSGTDYTGMMDGFLTASTAQFLTGAGGENRVYSPLNVYMALSMLAETTGGNTRQQILDLLQVDSMEALHARAAALWKDNYRDDGVVTSILANSLWLRDGMTYSQNVLDTLAQDYYASSFSGEMGAEEYNQALRDWLNEQTRGLLAEQADGLEMEPETVLALASTIYFKAAWSDEFNESSTERDLFHAPGGDVETDFMRQTLSGAYYWGEHFSAVSLSFRYGGSMWLILPDEGYTVEELLESGETIEFLMADKSGHYDETKDEYILTWPNQKYLNINLSMPRFDVSSDLDLIEGLRELGVTDVFDDTVSNFEPLEASTDAPLYVSQARHAARVKVDEEGCEAAAYTVSMLDPTSEMLADDEVDFILDRPFLFAITSDSGLPLFTGVVNQPNA